MKTLIKTIILSLLATAAVQLPAPTPAEKTAEIRTKAEGLVVGTTPLYVVNDLLDKMADVIYWIDYNRPLLGSHNNPSFQHDDGTYFSTSELENLQIDYKEIYNMLAARFGLPAYSVA